LVRGENLE